MRRIRKGFGGTVNDVVLAAVADGYRDAAAGTAARTSTTPCSVRSCPCRSARPNAHGVPDNRVSPSLYDLPVDIADPVERLDAGAGQMSDLKRVAHGRGWDAVTTFADLAPPMVVGNDQPTCDARHARPPATPLNTVTTNVPGPQFPLYCLGREMVEYRPFVPISHGVRIGTAILSYNGRLAFGVTGDFDNAPDVDVLADAIRERPRAARGSYRTATSVVPMKSIKHLGEPFGHLDVGEVADAFEDLEPAAGHRLVRLDAVARPG